MLCHLLKAIKYFQGKEPNDSSIKKMELHSKASCFFRGGTSQANCQNVLIKKWQGLLSMCVDALQEGATGAWEVVISSRDV